MSVNRLPMAGRLTIGAICAVALALACDNSAAPVAHTFRGADVPVGGGTARSEVIVEGDVVTSISAVFSESALTNLPATLPTTEFMLPMPVGAPTTVVNHIGLNWNPQGHPPPMVYTVPHFDTHFYFISLAQRQTMTPADPAFATKAAVVPPADQIASGYVADPQGIPMMGTHYTDSKSAEFMGSAFTSTLVYGYYEGKMIFVEPMMTKAFIESNPNETKAIRVPARYPAAGRYATAYSVTHDVAAKEYRVTLKQFVAGN